MITCAYNLFQLVAHTCWGGCYVFTYICMVGVFIGPKEVIGHYHETIGEALQGVELEFSGLDISFKG